MSKKKTISRSVESLGGIDKQKRLVRAVIETPKGSRNKFKYDEELRFFTLSGVLPAGAVFPFDFGFIPQTLAEDGDPLDILVLMDVAAFAGCVVLVRLIGNLEAEQTEESGEKLRNDRLVAVADADASFAHIHSFKDLSAQARKEIEHFFVSYNAFRGRVFRPLGWRPSASAWKVVEQATQQLTRKSAA